MRHLGIALLLLTGCSIDSRMAVSRGESLAVGQREIMVYLRADQAPASFAGSRAALRADHYQQLVARAEETQASVISLLAGTDYRPFHIVNAILVRNATSALVAQLEAHPDVARVTNNQAFELQRPPSRAIESGSGGAGIEPSLVATGADRVWSELGVKGAGVVVAGQDTGVDWTHPALQRKYRGWDGTAADHRYSWHDAIHPGVTQGNPCGYDAAAPCDDNGHGTHTMGTMVGDDGAGNQVGMAPDAKWIACRNMDENMGKPSTYIECFEWFLAPYPQGGDPRTEGDPSQAPDVVNNSWGLPGQRRLQRRRDRPGHSRACSCRRRGRRLSWKRGTGLR